MDIKYLKEEISIEMAEYTVAKKISEETEFAKWLPYTPKKRNRIISNVKTNY